MNMAYKHTTKRAKYGLKIKDIARLLDYTTASFYNSKKKYKILKGIETIIGLVEEKITH